MITVREFSLENKERTLISNLNIHFKQGELWAVVGKNGTGKTTLVNTLAGFMTYQQGCITIDGKEISTLDSLSKAQQVAFLPQLLEAGLDCTVKQSIAYGRYPWHKNSDIKQQDSKIIQLVIRRMQLESIQDKSIHKISGGELRKVEIATVLAQDSKIMMLDEPLNHLDVSMRFHLMEHLQTLIENKLIIIVTHDIQYVQEYCTHVLMLQGNTNVKFGTVSEIMTKDNLINYLGASSRTENLLRKS
ncbi:MAG: ABC transporter ATP-binding protein [Proteobacteria bacterium]|nr:ABC transporter ATP-binding protein [Pseudomonadota bacterium]